MKPYPLLWFLNISVVSGLLVFNSTSTKAQIVRDTTLPENSVVKTQNNTIQIDGGTRAGNNLFHSFEQFSVPIDQTAFFNNAVDIQNILSRVTGSSISQIDGALKARGTANLFLINPNGIIFGKNASLNIGGSFIASTANSIIFDNGYEFSTTATQSQPLLTINVPIGLRFGETPGNIINQSRATVNNDLVGRTQPDPTDPTLKLDPKVAGLQVQPGKTLALVGGDVVLEGGNLTANEGRIELGSVAGNSLVNLTLTEKGWALGYDQVQNFQDISLFPRTIVDTSGEIGGKIHLQGRRVTLSGDQMLSPVLVFSNTVGAGQGDNLTVTASEAIELSGNLAAFWTQTLSAGSAGNLIIKTRDLTLKDGGLIQSAANLNGKSRAGDLTVSASKFIEMIGTTLDGIRPTAIATFGITGNGGNLRIDTERLVLKDGAQIATSTFGTGQAGNLKVFASNIELTKTLPINTNFQSAIVTQAFPYFSSDKLTTGDAGDLTIETKRLTALNGGFVSASTFGSGQGGNLTINASDFIKLSGTKPTANLVRGSSGLFVLADEQASGNAGNLFVKTGQLIVENGAKVSAETLGEGNAGNATINVDRLLIRDGGQVRAGSFLGENTSNKQGSGGTLTVNATDSVEVIGSGTIGSNTVKSSLLTLAEGTGSAGNLNIFTPNLTLKSGTLTAETASGEGGNIKLQVDEILLLQDSSLISAKASGNAKGGNINIDAGFVVAFFNRNNDIIANAKRGNGGNINITTETIFGLEERSSTPPNNTNDIDARSEFGLDGKVSINSLDVDPSRRLVRLPNVPVNVEVAQGCQAEGKQASVEFFNTGKGGLAPSPYEPLSSSNIWEDVPPPTQETANSANEKSPSTSPDKIIEAQGWQIDEKGQVILVAEVPKTSSQSRCRLQ